MEHFFRHEFGRLDGFGAGVIVSFNTTDLLVLKPGSPLYTAVIECVPVIPAAAVREMIRGRAGNSSRVGLINRSNFGAIDSVWMTRVLPESARR